MKISIKHLIWKKLTGAKSGFESIQLHYCNHIMWFNVSICFKMGSLYSYYGIITKLVYPPELSRITGFCTNSNKIFLGEDTQTPLSSRIVWGCIITIIQKIIKKKNKNTYPNLPLPPFFWRTQDQIVSVCLIWKVHCWPFFREWMFERIKKSPWKCTSKVLEKSLK